MKTPDKEMYAQSKSRAKEINIDLNNLEHTLSRAESELFSVACQVPNETHESVPIGDESEAVTLEIINPHLRDPLQRQAYLIDLLEKSDSLRALKLKQENGIWPSR
jgi:seryl-tRNA synthetase